MIGSKLPKPGRNSNGDPFQWVETDSACNVKDQMRERHSDGRRIFRDQGSENRRNCSSDIGAQYKGENFSNAEHACANDGYD